SNFSQEFSGAGAGAGASQGAGFSAGAGEDLLNVDSKCGASPRTRFSNRSMYNSMDSSSGSAVTGIGVATAGALGGSDGRTYPDPFDPSSAAWSSSRHTPAVTSRPSNESTFFGSSEPASHFSGCSGDGESAQMFARGMGQISSERMV